MAWSDEPSEPQLDTLYMWLFWAAGQEKAAKAVRWLKNTATRREVSIEMTRLKRLKDGQLLNSENCFESEIWEGFDERS